ncbi:MAG: hypothetical protein AAF292_05035 [Pseudomonadota bacterium]
MNKLVALASALIASLLSIPPTTAQTNLETYEVLFTFDRAAPAEITYRELRREARRACRLEGSPELEFSRTKAERACHVEFMELAVSAIGSSELSSYYTARTGRFAGEVALAENNE